MKRLGTVCLAAAAVAILAAGGLALRKLAATQEEFSTAVGPDAAEKDVATRRADAIWNAVLRRDASVDSRPASSPSIPDHGR